MSPSNDERAWHRRARERFGELEPWQKIALILASGVVVLLLLVVLRPEPARQQPPPRAPLVQTVAAEVESGPLTVYGGGTVRPVAEVAIVPQVGGKVSWVSPSLESGGRVREGQTLVRIEASDYVNAVRQARAEVAAREVDLMRARQQMEIAREEYDRFKDREPDAAPPDSDATALVLNRPQLEAARAALERARATLADARLRLSRSTIEAPFDGVVRSESVDRGQVVAPGQSIASIYASDAVEIVVPLTDDEAALLPELWERTPGEAEAREVPVVVIAEYGGREYAWHGFVDRAEGTLGAGTRTIDVVVRVPSPLAPRSIDPTLTTETTGVPDPRPPLLLDTYVNVEIEGVSLERYVTLPRVALREGPSVWVVRRDSILEMVPVRAIQETDDLAHLHAPPIEDGDRVVVSDLAAPTDGMRVRVATE